MAVAQEKKSQEPVQTAGNQGSGAPILDEMIKEQRESQERQKLLEQQKIEKQLSNSHDVASYVFTEGKKAEVVGPLTNEALLDLVSFKSDQFKRIDSDSIRFGMQLEQVLEIGIVRKEFGDQRHFVVTELDEQGQPTSKQFLLSGRYDNSKRAVASGDTISTTPPQINIDSIQDLETGHTYDVQGTSPRVTLTPDTKKSAFVVRLTDNGNLTQAGATEIASTLDKLPKFEVNFYKQGKSSDGLTTLEASGIRADRFKIPDNLEALVPQPTEIKIANLALPIETAKELGRQVGSLGEYVSALTVTDTDPATQKTTTRILLGHLQSNIVSDDPLVKDPERKLVFTKSFNVNTVKTSNFETPVEIPLADHWARQSDVDALVNKVRAAAEKGEIVRADRNPEFDRMLAQGPSAQEKPQAEIGQLSPDAASAAVAAGKKIASIA